MIKNEDQSIPVQAIKRVAAIDIGTNSFHAVIADIYSDGSFRTVDKLKEMVQLAKGGLDNELSDGAFRRGMKALSSIKTLIDSYDCEQIMAYATSAIREAVNGGEFIQKSIDELDIKIRAIPGKMEAELIGYAVQHGMNLGDKNHLMVDIGGGSVEFIIGNDHKFDFLASKKIGVARMTEQFDISDPITEEEIKALKDYYEQNMQDIAEAFARHRTDAIVGSSGTMQNIAYMIAAKNGIDPGPSINGFTYNVQQFEKFYQWFIKLNKKERKKVSGLESKRVDIINTGVVLMHYLVNTFGIKEVKISDQALREGIIVRYLKREMIGIPWTGEFANPRRRSVFELLRKCNWQEDHSRHVANLALELFDNLKTELDLQDSDRELLEYASYLHDIGYYISHSKHHKHALYIIRHADLKGFNREEIEIIANVARYHRRSTPKKRHGEYWKMKAPVRKRIKKLSGILRVADGLDRSHFQNVQKVLLESSENSLNIKIKTQDEPYLEIWGAMRKSHLLREVLGKKIVIERV